MMDEWNVGECTWINKPHMDHLVHLEMLETMMNQMAPKNDQMVQILPLGTKLQRMKKLDIKGL